MMSVLTGGWDLSWRQYWERHPRHLGSPHSAAGRRGNTFLKAFSQETFTCFLLWQLAYWSWNKKSTCTSMKHSSPGLLGGEVNWETHLHLAVVQASCSKKIQLKIRAPLIAICSPSGCKCDKQTQRKFNKTLEDKPRKQSNSSVSQ